MSAVRMRSDVRAALAEDPEAFYASVYEGAEADGVLCGAACRSILHSQARSERALLIARSFWSLMVCLSVRSASLAVGSSWCISG